MLRNEGEIITHKTVERLMRAEGLHASRKRRYRPTTDSTAYSRSGTESAATSIQRSGD
ncbi:MAG: transposase [Ignavibacteria bacterium]|nr:transposase [Ignavibacteria bacterium]